MLTPNATAPSSVPQAAPCGSTEPQGKTASSVPLAASLRTTSRLTEPQGQSLTTRSLSLGSQVVSTATSHSMVIRPKAVCRIGLLLIDSKSLRPHRHDPSRITSVTTPQHVQKCSHQMPLLHLQFHKQHHVDQLNHRAQLHLQFHLQHHLEQQVDYLNYKASP